MIDVIISSPPFIESLPSGDTSSSFKKKYPNAKTGGDWGQSYGLSNGQLGTMTTGSVNEVIQQMIDVIISSPPFQGSLNSDKRKSTDLKIVKDLEKRYKRKFTDKSFTGQDYGLTVGQLGTMTGNLSDILKGLKMTKKTKPIPVTDWQSCYDGNWKGIITEESFTHPAKYAKGLVDRILQHLFEEGWVERGSTVVITQEILKQIKSDIESGDYVVLK